MGERRALIEGLTDEDREREDQFVFNNKKPRQTTRVSAPAPKAPARQNTEEPPPPPPPPPSPPLPQSVLAAAQVHAPSPLTGIGRVPIGARVRTELAVALKRASLERQLQGIQPSAVQDILEEAVELWLLKNGHPLK
jgi:hypothetical protein